MSSKRKRKPLSAKLASWWHPILNGNLRPEDVSAGSGLTVYFLHYDEKWKQWHEWDSTPNIMRLGNCLICTGRRLVVGINDLATRNPNVASMWHPTLNGELTPEMVTEHSGETRWWQHKDEETGILHEWPMPIDKLTGKELRSCSVCRGLRVQVGANDLVTTHSVLASEWHPTLNGMLTPQMVSKGSREEVWWLRDCRENGIFHEWHSKVSKRTGAVPRGCAICSGHQIQIGVNDLASQYPELAKEWDYVKNKKLTPQMVTVSSGQSVKWKHKSTKGSLHRWPARIADRTSSKPTGCPESECSKTGFDPNKPAHLYILYATINKMQVIQFGISNNIERRLRKHARSGFKNIPVRLISFHKGSNARFLELSILDLVHEHGIPSCSRQGIKFDGSTEAFCLEDADKEFLEEFMELVGK